MNGLFDVLGTVLAPVSRHVLDDGALDEPEAIGVNEFDRLDRTVRVVPPADLAITRAHKGAPRNHATPSMIWTSSGGIRNPPLNVSTTNP